jgi:hypothetical protein
MRLFSHTSTRAVGLALLTGLWAAACTPSKDNTTGNGGAKGGSASSSSSTPTGGTTATSSAQTGGATSNPTGGTTATSSAQTGGATSNPTGGTASTSSAQTGGVTSNPTGGTTATSSAQTGGVTNPGGTTTAGGGAGVGGSSSGGAGVGGSSSGGAAVGGSDSGGAGVGGTTSQTGGNSSAGGTTSAGGSIAVTCPAATSYAACTTDAGVVAGAACKPNPPMFALDANCNIGLWASDYTSSGYFYQPWCNSATTTCTLTMACATNSMHIAGSYLGSSTAAPMDGNAGWGGNLQTTYPDAGPGCQMIDGSAQTGLTLDINVTTLPTGNHLDIGISLANGNSADYTAVLTTGPQTVKIPWACFKNKLLCGSVPGPGITNFFFAFDWFNDGVAHAVDITLSNIGFY